MPVHGTGGVHVNVLPGTGGVTVFNMVHLLVFNGPVVVAFQSVVVVLLLKSVAALPPKPTSAVLVVVLKTMVPKTTSITLVVSFNLIWKLKLSPV